MRISVKRRLSQSTAMPPGARPELALTKASRTASGATLSGVFQIDIIGRDFHRRARLADGLEISPRREPRAGAVLVPLVVDQARRRHQIEHAIDDAVIKPRRRLHGNIPGSPFRIAATARARRTNRAAPRIARRRSGRCHGPRRRTTATTTATAHRSRIVRARSAAHLAPKPRHKPRPTSSRQTAKPATNLIMKTLAIRGKQP